MNLTDGSEKWLDDGGEDGIVVCMLEVGEESGVVQGHYCGGGGERDVEIKWCGVILQKCSIGGG